MLEGGRIQKPANLVQHYYTKDTKAPTKADYKCLILPRPTVGTPTGTPTGT